MPVAQNDAFLEQLAGVLEAGIKAKNVCLLPSFTEAFGSEVFRFFVDLDANGDLTTADEKAAEDRLDYMAALVPSIQKGVAAAFDTEVDTTVCVFVAPHLRSFKDGVASYKTGLHLVFPNIVLPGLQDGQDAREGPAFIVARHVRDALVAAMQQGNYADQLLDMTVYNGGRLRMPYCSKGAHFKVNGKNKCYTQGRPYRLVSVVQPDGTVDKELPEYKSVLAVLRSFAIRREAGAVTAGLRVPQGAAPQPAGRNRKRTAAAISSSVQAPQAGSLKEAMPALAACLSAHSVACKAWADRACTSRLDADDADVVVTLQPSSTACPFLSASGTVTTHTSNRPFVMYRRGEARVLIACGGSACKQHRGGQSKLRSTYVSVDALAVAELTACLPAVEEEEPASDAVTFRTVGGKRIRVYPAAELDVEYLSSLMDDYRQASLVRLLDEWRPDLGVLMEGVGALAQAKSSDIVPAVHAVTQLAFNSSMARPVVELARLYMRKAGLDPDLLNARPSQRATLDTMWRALASLRDGYAGRLKCAYELAGLGRGMAASIDALVSYTAPEGWDVQQLPVTEKGYLPPLPGVRTLGLHSGMATGKSFQMIETIKQTFATDKDASVIYVSPRVSLSSDFNSKLESAGIKTILYSDRDGRDRVGSPGYVTIISPQSLHLLQHLLCFGDSERCDLLLLDESETTLTEMCPNTTHHDNLINNWAVLMRIVKETARVIACDAMMSSRTLAFLNVLRGSTGSQLIVNPFVCKPVGPKVVGGPNDRQAEAHLLVSAGHTPLQYWQAFKAMLMVRLKAGERVYVVCAERKKAEELEKWINAAGFSPLGRGADERPAALLHTGRTRNAEALKDVNGEWPLSRCIICTTSVTVGVDFNPTDFVPDFTLKFNGVFAWCDAVCLPRDQVQSMRRPRVLTDPSPALVLAIGRSPRGGRSAPPSVDSIRAQHEAIKASRKHCTVAFQDAGEATRQVDAFNAFEKAVSKAAFETLLVHFVEGAGFSVMRVDLPLLPEADIIDNAVDEAEDDAAWCLDYTLEPNLDEAEYQGLRFQKTTDLTLHERWAMAKFRFKTATRYAGRSARAAAWARVVFVDKPGELSPVLFNLKAEKQGLHDMNVSAADHKFSHQADAHFDLGRLLVTDTHQPGQTALLSLLGLTNSVQDGAVIAADKFTAVTDWLLKHEVEAVGLTSFRSAAKDKGHKWARALASKLLDKWAGTTLKHERTGKNKDVHTWVVVAPNCAVAAAVGLIPIERAEETPPQLAPLQARMASAAYLEALLGSGEGDGCELVDF